VEVISKCLLAVRPTGIRYQAGTKYFSSSQPRPDRPWSPTNPLTNGYRGQSVGIWSWPRTSIQCRGL